MLKRAAYDKMDFINVENYHQKLVKVNIFNLKKFNILLLSYLDYFLVSVV